MGYSRRPLWQSHSGCLLKASAACGPVAGTDSGALVPVVIRVALRRGAGVGAVVHQGRRGARGGQSDAAQGAQGERATPPPRGASQPQQASKRRRLLRLAPSVSQLRSICSSLCAVSLSRHCRQLDAFVVACRVRCIGCRSRTTRSGLSRHPRTARSKCGTLTVRGAGLSAQ